MWSADVPVGGSVGRAEFILVLLSLLLSFSINAEPAFPLSSNDVVAFVGGADVSSAQLTGHLESLLTCAFPGARFRNFGWEGDTVYAQPRDFAFPPLTEHLRKAGATVIVLQFGRTEALTADTNDFRSAYKTLLSQFREITPRLALVAPPPFENGGGLLPNLAPKNPRLAEYAQIIRDLAHEFQASYVDLFSAARSGEHLTDDGLQLSMRGQALCALAFAKQIGIEDCAVNAGDPKPNGAWSNATFEALRQAVITKNRYWFNYWRPQNWAFLGGDRTEQPSSRDHRNPKIRWFPTEIEKFSELIKAEEATIQSIAAEAKANLTQSSPRHKENATPVQHEP